MAYQLGVDVSWPQGNYKPGAEEFVGVGAVSLDGGKPFVQSTYHVQVDNVHAAGKPVIHYAFNGRIDTVSVEAFADYFIANLYDFRPGDKLALDVEPSEVSPGHEYPSWTPAQALAFLARLATHSHTLDYVYGDTSDMTKPGWGQLKAHGSKLWIAWPGVEGSIRCGEWGDWDIWQYGSPGGIDHNWAKNPIGLASPVPANKAHTEDTNMIIEGGTVALIPTFGMPTVYTSMGGGEGFSIEANSKIGQVSGLTGDEVTTLVNEAAGRYQAFLSDVGGVVALALAKQLPVAAGGTAPTDAQIRADVEAAVTDAMNAKLASVASALGEAAGS